MPAARTGAGALAANVPTEQEEVDNLLNGGDGVWVLGQSHGPATNGALRAHRNFSRSANLFTGNATAKEDVVPARRPQIGDEQIEGGGVILDEFTVEPGTWTKFFIGQHFLHDAFQHCYIAVDPDRQPEVA